MSGAAAVIVYEMGDNMRTGSNNKTEHNTGVSRIVGFTLVELLVVISIIGLLMGVLMPALGRARASAVRAACQSNLRQIGIAFRAYLDDNRDIMPLACAFPWDITDQNNPEYAPPITKFLGPLLKEPDVFICRADTCTLGSVSKYYLKIPEGGTSYYYNGRQQGGPGFTDGLGGKSIALSFLAKSGIKEKNIDVMSDFDAFHLGFAGTWKTIWQTRVGRKNYLYADWHVGDYKNQDY